MKIRFKNDYLIFLTSHSYTIYLSQRVVMIYFSRKGYFKENVFINFFFEFLIVIFIALVFDKCTSFLDYFFIKKDFQLKQFKELAIRSKLINNKKNEKIKLLQIQ